VGEEVRGMEQVQKNQIANDLKIQTFYKDKLEGQKSEVHRLKEQIEEMKRNLKEKKNNLVASKS
jgi:hypothetical protein